MSDMAKKVKFEYDALVLHSDEERGYAEQFCEHVRKCIVLPGEKSPKITTLDEFSTPGKQIIAILNEAMKDARFIFVSEEYYCTDHMGYFSGNVAILCKIPDKFVRLKIEGQCFTTKGGGTGKPVLESFYALSIGETWEISESAEKKLQRIFFTGSLQSLVDETKYLTLTHSQNQQNKVIPEVHSAENLHVSNPSISSTSSMQSLGSNETDVKNLASSPATVDNEVTALKVETSGATPHSVNNASDLTSFGDLVDDKEEDVATPHAGVPVADSVRPPVRHNQCKDTAAMNPSPQAQNQENLAPNPGIQGQNPGPQVPDQRPLPPTSGPQAPNLDCQAPRQSLAEQSRGSQEAETFDVASSSSGGGTTANPVPTKNRITTFKSLQDTNQVSVFRPFETGGRSMLGVRAAGGSVSSNPDDVAARRERHANSAEKRLRDAKEGDN